MREGGVCAEGGAEGRGCSAGRWAMGGPADPRAQTPCASLTAQHADIARQVYRHRCAWARMLRQPIRVTRDWRLPAASNSACRQLWLLLPP